MIRSSLSTSKDRRFTSLITFWSICYTNYYYKLKVSYEEEKKDLDFKKIVEPYFDEALTTLVKNVQINSVYDPLTVSTSSPYGFSEQGLENKLKLLVYHANKVDLTIEDYYNLKYGNNNYEEINIKIKKLCNIKYDQRLSSNHSLEYKINTSLPILDSPSENNRLKELTSIRQEIYVI